jgi:hypothetical protein
MAFVLQMRGALKEILVREEKLATQNSVLVTLAAGTQEEIKVIHCDPHHSISKQVMFEYFFQMISD